MHLERANGRHQHDAVRRDAGLTAFDVHEFLGAEVGAEAGFGDHVIGELQRRRRRQHRIAAVGDIGERAAMNEGGRAFERLHQIRRQRFLEQHGHGALRLEIAGAHRFPIAGIGDDDVAEPLLEVVEVARQAENRHDLGGDSDVKAVFAREPIGDAAQRGHHRAQRTIVHIEHPAPRHAARIDAERIAPINVVVEQSGEQIVRRGDGMKIAGEVQIDIFHRHDLRVAAAGGTALDAERRAQRRLADAQHRLLADVIERVGQSHRGRGLALACGRRVDGANQNELAVGPALQ